MILKITDVKKYFGGIKALDECSMTIKRGEITAIIGPNGSGKTTLFNAICKIIDIDSGNIMLYKEDNNDQKKEIALNTMQDFAIAKIGISRTFQQVRLFKNLTIKDHISIALATQDEKLWKSMFENKKNQDNNAQIKEILASVHLHKDPNTLASELSYGQRKLLDLAIAIAKPHHIILLDEPVAGVNPQLREEIKKIIRTLNKKGETILLIEHDMNFVMDLADNIFVMESGKVIAQGKPKQIQNNKKVLDAYLGG